MGSSLNRRPQGKKFAGTDLTGSDGDLGRTLTVAFPLLSHHAVSVDGAMLYETTHYSIVGNVITFDTVGVFDDSELLVTE